MFKFTNKLTKQELIVLGEEAVKKLILKQKVLDAVIAREKNALSENSKLKRILSEDKMIFNSINGHLADTKSQLKIVRWFLLGFVLLSIALSALLIIN
jgi:20S proteasome alpha/beta subunit